jgi:hypothetical protein
MTLLSCLAAATACAKEARPRRMPAQDAGNRLPSILGIGAAEKESHQPD